MSEKKKKIKKNSAKKFIFNKLTQKVRLNFEKTFKKLNNKKKKVKKVKKIKKVKTSIQFKARQKLKELISKQKQRENTSSRTI